MRHLGYLGLREASSRCPDALPGDTASFQERVPWPVLPEHRKTPKRSLQPSAILEPKF